MDCVKDKIYLAELCKDTAPTTGQIDVGGVVSYSTLSAIASNTQVNGARVHQDIVNAVSLNVFSRFRNLITSSGYAIGLGTFTAYSTSAFNSTTPVFTSGKSGVCLVSRKPHNATSIYKMKITGVELWFNKPYTNVTLYIESGGYITPYILPSVTVGLNTIPLLNTSPYFAMGTIVKVYLDGVYEMQTVNSNAVSCSPCFAKNHPCGSFSGYFNGTPTSDGKMYGLNVIHGCDCDFESLFCNLVNQGAFDVLIQYLYELNYWLKVKNTQRINASAQFIAEQVQHDIERLNKEVERELVNIQAGMANYLKGFNDGLCINCRGISQKPNAI